MENLRFIIAITSVVTLIFGCSKDDTRQPDPVAGEPVENNAPNTNYVPAFAGQTRISGVQTTTAYSTEVVTSSLASPWGITGLPDGRLLITEKAGQMRIISTSGNVSPPLTVLPAVNPAGQGGLLGVCIDPNFTANRMVYWSFSEAVAGGNVTAIAKGSLSNDESTIENVVVIYRAYPAYSGTSHYGGRIIFDGDGNLLASTGERSDLSTRPLAQSVSSGLGKIIRITTDGQPTPGNPVFEQPGALAELFTTGHRNPQGLARHPVTGDVWQTEHGPRGGDELNRIQPGNNYGWPIITYGIEYSGQPIGNAIQVQDGLEQPAYYWDPVISPSGMSFYSGNRVPEWQNNLFIGSLSGQHIARLVIENNLIVGEERLLADAGQRFRDITQGTDGALYAITDQGRLYKIDRE